MEKLASLDLVTHVRNVFSCLVLARTQLRMEQPPTVVLVERRGLLVLGRCFDFWRSLHHQQFQNHNQHERNKLETQSFAAFTLSNFIEASSLPPFCGEMTCPSLFNPEPEENLGYPGCIISTPTNQTPPDKVVQWMLLWHTYLRYFHPNSPLRLCSQHVWKYNIAVSGLSSLSLPCKVSWQPAAGCKCSVSPPAEHGRP